MAKIDFPADSQGPFSDPAAYINSKFRPKPERKRPGRASRTEKTDFTSVLERSQELEALEAQPVSEETVNKLLEDVQAAGDTLQKRPFPPEILAYKRAVRNFMRYAVDNSYRVEEQLGIPQYLRPNFKGPRGSADAQKRLSRHMIQVADRKLEELAASLMKGQLSQLEILSRLEEIKGLLVDLVS
jgi:uncharacterized protein YaaR (DUF327 family)